MCIHTQGYIFDPGNYILNNYIREHNIRNEKKKTDFENTHTMMYASLWFQNRSLKSIGNWLM